MEHLRRGRSVNRPRSLAVGLACALLLGALGCGETQGDVELPVVTECGSLQRDATGIVVTVTKDGLIEAGGLVHRSPRRLGEWIAGFAGRTGIGCVPELGVTIRADLRTPWSLVTWVRAACHDFGGACRFLLECRLATGEPGAVLFSFPSDDPPSYKLHLWNPVELTATSEAAYGLSFLEYLRSNPAKTTEGWAIRLGGPGSECVPWGYVLPVIVVLRQGGSPRVALCEPAAQANLTPDESEDAWQRAVAERCGGSVSATLRGVHFVFDSPGLDDPAMPRHPEAWGVANGYLSVEDCW